MRKVLCLLAVAVLFTGCQTTEPMPTLSGQSEQKFRKRVSHELTANYLLHLPPGYAGNTKKRWPLMIFLHGAGERGTNLSLVAKHGPPKIVREKADFPFILVSPQCPPGESWDNETIMALLDHATEKYRVDTNRIYLTGLSMGGFGTWALAAAYPNRFAAVAPICGGGETIPIVLADRRKQEQLKKLPVWAFHGAKDPVVKLEESEKMVNAFKRLGSQKVELTVHPEATHDSWTVTYENPKLYDWFLSHSLRVR